MHAPMLPLLPMHSPIQTATLQAGSQMPSVEAMARARVSGATDAQAGADACASSEYHSRLGSHSATFTVKIPSLHLVQHPTMAMPEWRGMLRARLERLLSEAASRERGSCVSLRLVTLDVGAGCVVVHGRVVEGGTWGYSGAEVAAILQAVDASELLMRLVPPGARLLDGDTAVLQLGHGAPPMELAFIEADGRFVRSASEPPPAPPPGVPLLSATWPLLALPCDGGGRVHLQLSTPLLARALGHNPQLVVSSVPRGAPAARTPIVRTDVAILQAAARARGHPPGVMDIDVYLGSSPTPGVLIAQLVDGDALLAAHSVSLLPASAQPVVAELLRARLPADTMHDVALDLGVLLCGPRVRTPGDAAELHSVARSLMAWESTCRPALPALHALLDGLLRELSDGDAEPEASPSCSSPVATATGVATPRPPRANRPPLLWVWTMIIVSAVKAGQFIANGSGAAALALCFYGLPYALHILAASTRLFECLPLALRSVDSCAASRVYTTILSHLTMSATASSFAAWAVYCNFGGDIPLLLAWAWLEPPRSPALGAAISLLLELPTVSMFRWHALASCGETVSAGQALCEVGLRVAVLTAFHVAVWCKWGRRDGAAASPPSKLKVA
jgi:hypothetical protein